MNNWVQLVLRSNLPITRLKDKKAAIGFTYEDSTPGDKTEKKGGDDDDSDDSDEESDEDVETVDLGRWELG